MQVSEDVKRMMCGREAERIWLTVVAPGTADDFDGLARAAGLEPLGRGWVEVDEAQARRVLVAILSRGLTYVDYEAMPVHRAEWLAGQFLGAFGAYSSRFATNTDGVPGSYPWVWNPATEFTTDAGIAVIGEAGSGIYWVAEEG